MSANDPFSASVYTDEDWARYRSWPETAQELLDRSWSMHLGVYDLLARAFKLDDTAADRLCRLVQNLLIGRLTDLCSLPEWVAQGTGLDVKASGQVAAAIATTILIPFNTLVGCWDEDIRELYQEWNR